MKFMSKVLCLMLISLNIAFAEPLDLALFAKSPEFEGIKLSPDGKHLAVRAPQGNRTLLVILDRKTLKPIYNFGFTENQHVDEFYWASNEKMLFTRYIQAPSAERPESYHQIYAGNIDGTKKGVIFGYQAKGMQAGTHLNKNSGPDNAWGKILHMLPEDPKHIIISSRRMESDYDSSFKIIKLNINTRKKRMITRTPLGNMEIFFDGSGEIVGGQGRDSNGDVKAFLYQDSSWNEISKSDELNDFNLVSVSNNGDKLYLTTYVNNGTNALYEYDRASKAFKKLFHHSKSDIASLINNVVSNSLEGVEVMPGKVEYFYIDKTSPFSKLHANLVKAFTGNDITILSGTKDGSEVIIKVQSDINPGDYYLFNTKNNNAQYLLSDSRWIDPALMAKKQPIEFKSRDGQNIYGYLTMPTVQNKDVPLVTYVHGGPYGKQDTWFFDNTVQMLANNGYAVLQVNYRGSGGYGLKYEQDAYQKRSSLIQEDIIDGTKWALQQKGIADRACIMGWSFGGYSSVMAPLIEPELFSCSIAAAGIYDVIEHEQSADYSKVDSVAAHASNLYGDDEVLLKKESPITYIDKLKIPVFIVHGGKDERVPPEQAYMLRDALQARKIPFEWMFKKKEGHGFYNPQNRKEFYQKTLNFLTKHIR